MVVELPMEIEAALEEKAKLRGVTATVYLREVLERELGPMIAAGGVRKPLKSGRGMLAKYGPAPSAEEIAEARREMWGNFDKKFENI